MFGPSDYWELPLFGAMAMRLQRSPFSNSFAVPLGRSKPWDSKNGCFMLSWLLKTIWGLLWVSCWTPTELSLHNATSRPLLGCILDYLDSILQSPRPRLLLCAVVLPRHQPSQLVRTVTVCCSSWRVLMFDLLIDPLFDRRIDLIHAISMPFAAQEETGGSCPLVSGAPCGPPRESIPRQMAGCHLHGRAMRRSWNKRTWRKPSWKGALWNARPSWRANILRRSSALTTWAAGSSLWWCGPWRKAPSFQVAATTAATCAGYSTSSRTSSLSSEPSTMWRWGSKRANVRWLIQIPGFSWMIWMKFSQWEIHYDCGMGQGE